MINSRLLELLGSLNSKEWTELKYLIDSPAFNRNGKISAMYNAIIKKGSIEEITKKDLYKAAFGDRKVKDVYFRVLLTELTKVIERFFVFKKLEQDDLRSKLYLLSSLRERGSKKSFTRSYNEINDDLNKVNYRDSYQFLKEAEFAAEYLLYGSNKESDINASLNAIDNNIDLAYIDLKLDVLFKLLSSEPYNNSFKKRNDLKYVLNYIEDTLPEIKKRFILTFLKYLSLRMLLEIDTNGDETYKKLKSLILTNKIGLNKDMILQFISNLLTYCKLKQTANEDKHFAKEELKLYIKLLETAGSGYKPGANEFANIVDCALKNKENTWAYNYVDNYSLTLYEDVGEYFTSVALAKIAFFERRFDDAAKHLVKLKTDTKEKFREVNTLLLHIYKEAGEKVLYEIKKEILQISF